LVRGYLKRLAYYELRMQEEDLFGELEPEEKSQAGAFVGEIKGITKVESVGLEAEEIKLAKRAHDYQSVHQPVDLVWRLPGRRNGEVKRSSNLNDSPPRNNLRAELSYQHQVPMVKALDHGKPTSSSSRARRMCRIY